MGAHALFVGFIASITASDFSLPYILRSAFALALAAPPEALGNKETSQVPAKHFAYVPGVSDTVGLSALSP